MLTLVWLSAAVATIATARAFGAGFLTPAVTYTVVWGVAIILVGLQGFGYVSLGSQTWLLLYIALGAFLVGCLVATVGRVRRSEAVSQGVSYDEKRVDRLYWVCLAALVASTLLDVYRVLPLLSSAGGISGILGGQGLTFREATLQAAAQAATTNFQSGSLIVAVLGYAFFVGNLSLVLGARYAAAGRWSRAWGPLLLTAAYSLLTLQRFQFVYSLGIFLFSLAYYRAQGRRAGSLGSLRPLAALGAVLVLVLFVPLALRGQATTTSQRYQSVVDYVTGGLAGLNTTLAEPVSPPRDVPGGGAWTFYGLATIAKRLGAPIEVPPTYLPYLSIASNRTVENNVDTYLIYPLYDFGTVGVAIAAFILGLASTSMHRRAYQSARLPVTMAAGVLSTTVLLSFFGLSLIRDFRWGYLVAAAYIIESAYLRAPARQPEARHGRLPNLYEQRSFVA